MIPLALDLGTTTGWAILADGSTISGRFILKTGRYEGGGMRYLRFRKALEELYHNQQFQVVYFEEVRRHMGTDAAHVYGGMMSILTSWCEENSIPYQGIPVGTIKKHITGKGNAGKQAVIDAVKALGHIPEDDNEADAIALLDYVTKTKEV